MTEHPAPTSKPSGRDVNAVEQDVGTERLETFSDGVFAIAITLLVLELHVPEVSEHGLRSALLDEWPMFAAYFTSFLIIGIMWVNHHSMFRQIARSDRVLMFLNLLLLLWMAVLPFPTELVSRYLDESGSDAHWAAAVYSGNLTLAAIAFSLLWAYAVRAGLIRQVMSNREQWLSIARFSIGTLVYAATIALAFVSAPITLAVQFLIAAYYALEQIRTDPGPSSEEAMA